MIIDRFARPYPCPRRSNGSAELSEVPGATVLVLGLGALMNALVLALFADVVPLLFVQFWPFDREGGMHVMLRHIFLSNAGPCRAHALAPQYD